MGSISSSNSTGVLPDDWGPEDLTFIGNASISIHIVTYPVFTIAFDLTLAVDGRVRHIGVSSGHHQSINGGSDFFLVMRYMGIPCEFPHTVTDQGVSLAPSRRSRRDLRPVCEVAHESLIDPLIPYDLFNRSKEICFCSTFIQDYACFNIIDIEQLTKEIIIQERQVRKQNDKLTELKNLAVEYMQSENITEVKVDEGSILYCVRNTKDYGSTVKLLEAQAKAEKTRLDFLGEYKVIKSTPYIRMGR